MEYLEKTPTDFDIDYERLHGRSPVSPRDREAEIQRVTTQFSTFS
jgi:hypothetical protein